MLKRLFILCFFVSLFGVSIVGADDFDAAFGDEFSDAPVVTERLIADPLQPLNRGTFWVNDKLYFYLFKPIARGYRQVTPRPARVSVGNFFANLATPIRAGNALLQFKFRDFGTETYRFVINSTFGILGLFDPAESVGGVKKTVEDFGQTLGFYGVGHGFYLVLPIVGPSSLRDATGVFVDSYADPLRYSHLKTSEQMGFKMLDAENRLSLDRETYEGIVHDSLDPYLFIRAAYAQRRLAQVGEDTYNVNIFKGPLFDSDLLNPFDWIGF
ncbi:phospholipid-binding lipoprotein MlaA [Desulfuromusa kysingii]|uniref:Phospholipid-binding lipoprotein MlaA n=1 Tax=Desulfuromusa kysingii TaxID=37625 RepID=A0A1H3WUL7_9BACT|nr:VacJ family lipoprotein [Desulfuromusa kysingii]SDZ89878.1 phospholipid-binding lipoprotein MlaA [Desulfuromusa kysingii]